MEYGDLFVIIFLVYYTMYLVTIIFNKNKRGSMQAVNIKLDELRIIGQKTLEQQKEFLALKYPKKAGTFKFKWAMIPKLLLHIILFIALFQGYRMLFIFIGISVPLWMGLLFIITMPMIFNIVLRKFNLQKQDISIFFK